MQDIKEKQFEKSLEIVKEVFKDKLYQLSEEDYLVLTSEIMDTCVMAGGDYDEENVKFYAEAYIKSNFYHRFKRGREGY